jgi:alanine racemase
MPNPSKDRTSQAKAVERLEALLKKRSGDLSGPTKSGEKSGAELEPRVAAFMSAKILTQNYRAIQDLAPTQAMLPMIKANAYGHGAKWAARELAGQNNLYALGVATLEEGREVREALEKSNRNPKVIVFSGCSPWSEAAGAYCEKYGLTAVISSDADFDAFIRSGYAEKISYELEFNTGMNRLGINLGYAKNVIQLLKNNPKSYPPDGIFSHLAVGENPDAKLSRLQLQGFTEMRRTLGQAFPSAQFHLSNSSAVWSAKTWGVSEMTDIVRPGIALYGVPPWEGAPVRGIDPVMILQATVMSVRALKVGDQIGYGGTFTVTAPLAPKGEIAKNNPPFYVATLSAGYGDGILRALSNRGYAWLNDQESRFVGVVSMDLSAVSCTARTKPGDLAQILGPRVDIWAQAKAASTVPYELLTSISPRVRRFYD